MASGTSSPRSRVSFECSICLETLDKPSPLEQSRGNAIGQGDNQFLGPLTGATRRPRRTKVNSVPQAAVVVTHCGHLFHGLCLENWFKNSRARNCPSCYRVVERNKVFRLSPSSAEARREVQAAILAKNQSATINQADVTAHGGNHALPANPLFVGNQGEVANQAVIPGGNIGAADSSQPNQADDSGQNCARLGCADLKEMVNFLKADIPELQARIVERSKEVNEREAEGTRLEQNVADLKAENERLKAELKKRQDQDASKVSNIPHKRRNEQ